MMCIYDTRYYKLSPLQVSSYLWEGHPLMVKVLWMSTVLVQVKDFVYSVSLMPLTAALVLRGLYRESGSFPMELLLLLLVV